MKRGNRPVPALTALLDALEQELLGGSADEVRDAMRDSGRARDAVCAEIRSLLNEAQVESDAGSAVVMPFAFNAGIRVDRN